MVECESMLYFSRVRSNIMVWMYEHVQKTMETKDCLRKNELKEMYKHIRVSESTKKKTCGNINSYPFI